MTKTNLKKKVASMAVKVGAKQTQNDFNQACVMFIYQPKRSDFVKRSNNMLSCVPLSTKK